MIDRPDMEFSIQLNVYFMEILCVTRGIVNFFTIMTKGRDEGSCVTKGHKKVTISS